MFGLPAESVFGLERNTHPYEKHNPWMSLRYPLALARRASRDSRPAEAPASAGRRIGSPLGCEGHGPGRGRRRLRPLALASGVHLKVVSERLGHASIGITLGTYSHVIPGMQEEAAEKIDAGLRKALAG